MSLIPCDSCVSTGKVALSSDIIGLNGGVWWGADGAAHSHQDCHPSCHLSCGVYIVLTV